MGRFTTRVELHHSSTETDYKTLHSAMEDEGFSKEIKDDETNVWYKLPTAEYNLIDSSIESQQTVLQKAINAAYKVGKPYSVFVTKADGRTWHNLIPEDWTT